MAARPALLVLLAVLAGAAAEDATPSADLPPAARATLARLERSVEKLDAEHRKALNAERAKAVSDLEKQIRDETRKGNLDGAVATRAELDALLAAMNDGFDLLGNKDATDPRKQVLGAWRFRVTSGWNTVLTFAADGGVTCDDSPRTATWKATKDAIVFTWDTGIWHSFRLPLADSVTGDSSDLGKGTVSAQRVKTKD